MDAFRKQASRLRDQVAKQQQGIMQSNSETGANLHSMSLILGSAVIKHISGTGYESSEVMVTDEIELQRHHELEKLYRSTRAGKDFQKETIRACDTFVALGSKKIEAGNRFSEECLKYGNENTSAGILAKAVCLYGEARVHVEKEQEDLNILLSSQIIESLKAVVNSAPLEDARHLAQRYSRMRQEAEVQAAEFSKRQARAREFISSENAAKLHSAESKMRELKANMAVLGKEATAALAAVEGQQQRLTFQRLVAMVEAERTYHQRVAAILDQIQAEMISEKQRRESAPPAPPTPPPTSSFEKATYFLAEAIQAFSGESDKELSLSVGDYLVVRQISPTGWSEGECKGKAGWFPLAYVERRQRIPSIKVAAEVS
ncbi:SH3 domain-containing protein 3-like isoform X1 [Aristolochia californica]|uniref:SH3 domain-containing protein 3-like isoform X1 n=1 Tax=Aristolochia californica TaxID=171875 RepID=UPI0035E2F4A0